MLESKNDIHFLYLNFRSIINFRLKALYNKLLRGHFFLKKNIKNYKKENLNFFIHFGSSFQLEGFFNSQILGKNPIDISKKLPFKDSTIDIIFSSHLIEHLHLNEIIYYLQESKRIMKKNAVQIIATPSLKKVFQTAFSKNNSYKKTLFEKGKKIFNFHNYSASHHINVLMRAYGHRFVFDKDFLESINKDIGFTKIEEINIRKIQNKQIRDYLTKKPLRWKLESKIFLLTK